MAIAIRAEHLSKEYRLGTINHGMLFRDIQSWMARRMGKPDPHEKIGAAHYEDLPDRFWALKDVSFDIEQGDRVGIIGRNGAGKSTLLKVLSRITAPTEGRVKIKGRVVSLLEVGTGFHPELTGRENIYLNGAILGMKKRQVAKKMDEIIAFSEIEKFIDTPVKRYSSGMYVRLAFAVAAHLDADILLADEVLAVGDAAFQKKCLGKMEDVSKNQGRTVLFVSHNLSAVSGLCRHGFLLERGSVKASGVIKEVLDIYQDIDSNAENVYEVEVGQEKYLETVRIERYGIVDEQGQPVNGPLFQSRKYYVETSLEIKEYDPNLTMFVAFYASDDALLFISDVHDSGNAMREEFRIPGRKVIRCEIPTGMLFDGTYRATFSCCIHCKGWPVPPDHSRGLIFPFLRDRSENAMGYDNTNHPFSGQKKPGYLSPLLEWTVVQKG